jgi:hypothetical protein
MSESMGLAGDPAAVTGGEGNPAAVQFPNETVPEPASEEVTWSAETEGLVAEPAAAQGPLRRASEGPGEA